MIKLFVSDMDHTLLNNESQLPDNMEEVLDIIDEHGAHFIAASGRSLTNLINKFGDLSKRISFISDNGATLSYNGELLYTNTIDEDVVKDTIVKLRDAKESTIILISPNGCYYENQLEEHNDQMMEYYANITLVDDLTLHTKDIIKITTLSLNHSFENYDTYIKDKIDSSIYGVASGDIWIDMMNKGVNKAKALEHLLGVMDIHRDNVATFGDYYNDLEMIRYAKYGHAVDNAPDDVKEHAYRVIGTNDSGAVVNTILEYIKTGIEG